MTGTGPRQLNRPGTWGPRGTRERTSASTWAKPRRWAKLAREGKLPDGSPNLDGHRPRIFCASLADVFEPRPELEPWRRELFDLIEATPELDWLLLTKRPEEARDWLHLYYVEHRPLRMHEDEGTLWTRTPSEREWTSRDGLGWGVLPNVWVGTSIGTAEFTWRADVLRQIPAAVRFISAEPLLASLYPKTASEGSPARSAALTRLPGTSASTRPDQDNAQSGPEAPRARGPLDLTGIDWVIVGGESGGRHARPMHPAWAREIRDAVLAGCKDCAALGSKYRESSGPGFQDDSTHWAPCDRPALHFKQFGSWAPCSATVAEIALDPDGSRRDVADALASPGTEWMRYAGSSPKSGGKLLDGVEHCEFPTGAGALTPA